MYKKKTSTAVRSKPEPLSEGIVRFFRDLELDARLPKGVTVMNPYKDKETMALVRAFYTKYYAGNGVRFLVLGINPGRFGAGATGISFTDPIRLETGCGIPNDLPRKPELSSDFIYRMIDAYGGASVFYKKFFVSAVSPLGFTRAGKNLNYYDDKNLEKAIKPFAISCISTFVNLGMERSRCYCIGEGKNLAFLHRLNDEQHWFQEIIPLAHPRFIMQYRRKQLAKYIDRYVEALS